MHKIAHAKHWELHTSSLEGCTAYWNMNRQTDRMKGQIFVSKQAWMIATSVIKWTALCVLCTVEIYIKSADRQDKALASSSTDESEQFGKKYSMHKLVMELHKSCISRTNGWFLNTMQ